ncbi:protein FAM169B isoform X2 [Etheostoma spectabile]|uniref:protein FAM169B isoform X2 n=1 Tax=Etheostoma spectabile TaxID=54343 RepID=UPI0013AFE1E1|nr:protein FAM169B-like isoform X2 [Etheostoma spectabile]XP_032380255.1 protein FAM169B-like isoform X2 [Etheostoma spectabile]
MHEAVFLCAQVAITADSVRRVQLFEHNQPDWSLLALYSPDDPTQVVALYLHEKWWCVEDVLRTSSKSRSGLITVQSITERVIVFLLSQVVERSSQEKVLFSLHPPTESCKLLWRDSQAVGFYTVKHKGSLCEAWSSRCYLLPALDTVLVRRSWRRRGLGLQMLEDYCSSFYTETCLGISSPLSPSMAAVCRSFLQQHKEHLEQLYEVEAPGDWTQRRNIWLGIQLGRYSLGDGEENSPTSGEMQKNEGDDSSQKTSSRSVDPTSASTCNVSIPLVIDSPCDPSRGRSSPSREISGTGCPAAHADGLHPGSPSRPPQAGPSLSAEPRREKTPRRAKRVRRS